MKFNLYKYKLLGTLLATSILISGCSKQIFQMTAGMVQTFSEDYMVPYVLTSEDLSMSCAMAESMTPVILTMQQLNRGLEKIVISSLVSASICSQNLAVEKELEYQRALYTGDNSGAQDARIAMKRAYKEAAMRQYGAYQSLSKMYGEPGGRECPRLRDDVEELNYLIGLLAGLQAIFSDTQATSGLVPRNIAAKVERSSVCLDNKKWHGIPLAIRAAIWTLLPGAIPEGEDNWARLEEADKIGEKSGVRLSHVFHALAAYSKGDTERVRNVIRKHVESKKEQEANPKFRQLDAMATAQLTTVSDIMWTAAQGHRTPVGRLGKFWDDTVEVDNAINLDDIL